MITVVKPDTYLQSEGRDVLFRVLDPGASLGTWQRRAEVPLQDEVQSLVANGLFTQLKATGPLGALTAEIEAASSLQPYPYLRADVQQLLGQFAEITGCGQIRLTLALVESDMCRRFHTDITDYRLLCTYAGPGTQYILPEEEQACGCGDCEPGEEYIRQALPGHVLLFRGALSGTAEFPALLHKSPPAGELRQKRLLLRLDTTTFQSFL